MVKRYDCIKGCIEESFDGEFVSGDDYDALLKRVVEMEALLLEIGLTLMEKHKDAMRDDKQPPAQKDDYVKVCRCVGGNMTKFPEAICSCCGGKVEVV